MNNGYRIPWPYRGMILLGGFYFIAGILAGIWRIAVTRGVGIPSVPLWIPPHGHLMLGGFLAALIQFERMIGLRINRLVWVPYVYSSTAVLLHTGNRLVLVLHLVALVGWFIHRWMAYQAFHHAGKPLVESVAYATLSSALMCQGGPAANPQAALAAFSFPVAAIAVERLEISLQFKKKGAIAVLWAIVCWCVLWNAAVWLRQPALSWMGVTGLLLVIAVAKYDSTLFVSDSVGMQTMHQFHRVALRIAYAWLISGCVFLALWNLVPGAIVKDVVFHLFGLGFIFSMILGHAPIILPAALGKLQPKRPVWWPFLIFQFATLLRVGCDFAILFSLNTWVWSGWVSGLIHLGSFLTFMAMLARKVIKGEA